MSTSGGPQSSTGSSFPTQFVRTVRIRGRERHPEIDWPRPADTRNRIVHGYWSIDLEILYNTASEHVGATAEALKSVLPELEQSP
jgi:uncharacterized protein with HEPN domain